MPGHHSRLGALVIDCHGGDMDAHAAFWGAALGRSPEPADPGYPTYRTLEPAEGEIPVILQQVDHNARVHLDIETDDKEAECNRLMAAGAKVLKRVDEPGKNWIVMEAPSGHRFCLVKPQRPDFEKHANKWDDA